MGGTAVNKILDWEFYDQREYDQRIEDASYETELFMVLATQNIMGMSQMFLEAKNPQRMVVKD